jgi:AraC-like DNA-binding protein
MSEHRHHGALYVVKSWEDMLSRHAMAVTFAERVGAGARSESQKDLSTVLTSNLDFTEWDDAFATNKMLGAATLDRLRHAAYRVVLDGESYRVPRQMPETNKSTLAKGGKNKDFWSPFEPRIRRLSVAPLRRKHPAPLRRKATYVEDGSLYTSAGVTGGVDLSLYLLTQDKGSEVALNVAKRLVVLMQRAGGQSHSPYLTPYAEGSSPVAQVQQYVLSNLTGDLSVRVLAGVANMSVRTFARALVRAAKIPPAEFVEGARMDAACVMLEKHFLSTIAYALASRR